MGSIFQAVNSQLKFLKKTNPIKSNLELDHCLDEAIRIGDLDLLQAVLNVGADVNSRRSNRATPLYQAICEGNQKMVEVLIAAGAKVNDVDNSGLTPLNVALGLFPIREFNSLDTEEDVKIIRLLVEAGADVNHPYKEGDTPMHVVVSLSNKTVMKILLDAGADCDSRNDSGLSAFHYALELYDFNAIRDLLKAGSDASSRNSYGETALHIFVQGNDLGLVKDLLSRGLDPNDVDHHYLTPLHVAAIFNKNDSHLEVMKVLLMSGANIFAEDNQNLTPVDYLLMKSDETDNVLEYVFNYIDSLDPIFEKSDAETNDEVDWTSIFLQIYKDHFDDIQLYC